MKNNQFPSPRPILYGLTLALAATGLSSFVAQAHPYASGVTNNSGTIQFYLNENADNVGVSFDSGAATNNLGALSKGLNSFPLAGHSTYSIYVSKTGAGTPTLISVDTSNACIWNAPRGVAVNANPKSSLFGRVYGANSSPGGTGAAAKGRGLYIYNADLTDALGRGATASGTGAFVSDALSPNRLSVSTNNEVYVSDCSASGATVFSFDPDITISNQLLAVRGDAGQPLGYHGRIASAPIARGSLANGNLELWAVDSSLGPNFNELEHYPIGAGPVPWSNAPTAVVNLGLPTYGVIAPNNLTQPPTDMDVAPDGKLYAIFYRLNFVVPGLQVFDPSGTLLWDSITSIGGTVGTGPDLVAWATGGSAFAVRVSPDGKYVAVLGIDNRINVMAINNGLPEANTYFEITNTPSTGNGRDIAWDAADNVYAVSSGQGLMRVYSLGLTTTAVTSNDSTGTNGAFQLSLPATTASVVATTPQASQNYGTPIPGVFTITRTDAGGNYSSPITINFTLGGSATGGVYTCQPAGIVSAAANTIVIAAGQQSTNITIIPVNDGVSRPTNTVVLTLKGGATYSVVAPFQDTVYIQNTGPQKLFVSGAAASTMYKRFPEDYASFIITRWGDTTVSSYTVSSFNYAGTASAGVDFVTAGSVTIDPGAVTVTNKVSPLAPVTTYTGNKTIIVSVGSGGGYTAGPDTTTLTLLDNAYPPVPPSAILLSDPLTSAADASNWNITFGNGDVTNNPADYNVDFGYDLTTDPTTTHGIIPPPPSGATTALRLTCNKLFNPGSAAGVNVYYTNKAFSGNYSVRFNMNLIQGGNATYATEGVLFGINHTGSQSNWWYGSGPLFGGPWTSDGIWYWVSSDPGGAGAGDYLEFTGAGGTNGNAGWQQLNSRTWPTYENVFKVPTLFTTQEGGNGGVPANGTPLNLWSATNWCDVEIKQVNKVVTLAIDKTAIFTYTNTTVWTNGYLMLGYSDPYGGTAGVSVGNPDAAAYFSNLKVVSLSGPTITSIAVTNATGVLVKFTSVDGDDTAASFALQSAGTNRVAGPYADVSPAATISQLASGAFQATTTSTNKTQFYRIRHL
jgi:hypothetical protein